MKICRNILIVIFLFSFTFSYSQSIDAIKKKNEKTEREIAYLNKLLENARKDKSSTIQKVSIINQKIGKGKEMIQSLTNEVNYLDSQIKKNETVRLGLESDKQRMLLLSITPSAPPAAPVLPSAPRRLSIGLMASPPLPVSLLDAA